jgi:predicted amidophosphoribosyltransferase
MLPETAPPERQPLMKTAEPPAMRQGECPYCERSVLVYEEPPRCPLCACPLDEDVMRPFDFTADPAGEDR